MVAERFRASWSNSSRSPLKDPGLNPAWGREYKNSHWLTLILTSRTRQKLILPNQTCLALGYTTRLIVETWDVNRTCRSCKIASWTWTLQRDLKLATKISPLLNLNLISKYKKEEICSKHKLNLVSKKIYFFHEAVNTTSFLIFSSFFQIIEWRQIFTIKWLGYN